ncbi:MAG: glutamine--fructose-6-phosphate transaminase (isomerizing) [Clostridiaceae bacterium]|jgi:glucosamine--fructose-6-phosphate aminotransferase (isomerizing)|nr:glutamine--fructose-6-phosphate transaminase (isomerizing) [Clostridiaceae bacterium]
MCGIVGYVGSREATPVLMNGLKRLEYRGYDSAGIAILHEGKIKMVKTKGRLAALEEKLNSVNLEGSLGIGHTRWATHGEPSDANSHPHVSCGGKIAVVHNGIIENYMKLKDFLISKGYNFQSETDTEVVANLIDYNYKGDLVKAVMNTLNDIEGAYALGVICTDCPDEFVAARKDSPLIVGLGEGENYIASDIPAILEYTRDVIILEDKEVVRISAGRAEIYNLLGEKVERESFHVDWDVASAEKGGYEHFMMKEICEEPAVVKATISPRIRDGQILFENFNLTDEMVKSCEKINIIACGTAYHAGMVGKYAIERLARIPVEADLASEFRYRDPMINRNQITIIISQSGETLDTLMALREARKKGSHVVSIVNVVGSSIARESDDVLYTWAGPEIAVASTKAYNTQLAVLYLLALKFAQIRGTVDDTTIRYYLDHLMNLPVQMEEVLREKEEIQRFAAGHYNARSIFFIGRNLDYALSMEGSLKLKEISYIHSEAYAGGELKHGTIALIENGTLVICPLTQDMLFEKMVSNIREVKARGAVVMAITSKKHAPEAEKVADAVIPIPDIDPLIAPIIAVTPLQLFAYYVSVMKGNDVDKPRNLAKSVTVE